MALPFYRGQLPRRAGLVLCVGHAHRPSGLRNRHAHQRIAVARTGDRLDPRRFAGVAVQRLYPTGGSGQYCLSHSHGADEPRFDGALDRIRDSGRPDAGTHIPRPGGTRLFLSDHLDRRSFPRHSGSPDHRGAPCVVRHSGPHMSGRRDSRSPYAHLSLLPVRRHRIGISRSV